MKFLSEKISAKELCLEDSRFDDLGDRFSTTVLVVVVVGLPRDLGSVSPETRSHFRSISISIDRIMQTLKVHKVLTFDFSNFQGL